MTKEKIDPKIKENLFSTQTGVVISAINSIKEKGNKFYIPMLFDLLNSHYIHPVFPLDKLQRNRHRQCTYQDQYNAAVYLKLFENFRFPRQCFQYLSMYAV